MPKGYHGKVLRVNLTTGQTSIQTYDEAWYRTYLGGWGLIAYVLLTEVPPACDPLGPDNKLIIANGLLTGAPVAGSGRNAVGAKSPLNDGFGEADVGGYFGAELNHAGWDGIIVEGASERPVYLWIIDDQVELRDASHLWGRTTADVEAAIKEELGEPRLRTTQIGPAGENLCLHATVMNDINRAAGRTGLGAVMGSKRLRAVAVRGTGKFEAADGEPLTRWSRWISSLVKTDGHVMQLRREMGTSMFVSAQNRTGGLPTRNFAEGVLEGWENITGERMVETILVDRETCWACPVNCKRAVKTEDRWAVDPVFGGPEYETIASFGSFCGIDDLPAIAAANQLCNANGLDTIGAGVAIAWAMECFERGLLTTGDTGGIELRFGDAELMVGLVEDIIHRRGFGALLAQGAYRAAQQIGRGTEQYVMAVKKQEAPMHDPRLKHTLGVGYATSPTGADHMHNFHDTFFQTADTVKNLNALGIQDVLRFDDLSPAKIRMAKRFIHQRVFQNSAGLCNFMAYGSGAQAELISAATGWDFSVFELAEAGERALDMARVWNYRCGMRAADDAPIARFSEPTGGGPNEGDFVPAEATRAALEMYYDMMGWDRETGAPQDWKLHELGLSWLVE